MASKSPRSSKIRSADVTAVILAGGLGTRLREVVADRPKPLAWVAGRPFVGHLLEMLEKMGVRQVVFSIGYKAEQFSARLGDSFGAMALEYAVEKKPLGTGGAIRFAVERVKTPYTLVLNGDSFCEFDLAGLCESEARGGTALTLVLQMASAQTRFGSVVHDASLRVTGFLEKESGVECAGINAGIYLAATSFFHTIPKNKRISIEKELFPLWVREGKLHAFRVNGRFIDIGIPASFAEAQTFFREECQLDFASIEEIRRANPLAAAMFVPRKISEINKWKIAVGVVIRDARGQILLERRTDCGLWGLPGGRIDFGESAAANAAREIKEETGLDISIERFVGVLTDPVLGIMTYPNGDIVQSLVITVEAAALGGKLSASHESHELRYFPAHALPRLVMPHAQAALADCLHSATTTLR